MQVIIFRIQNTGDLEGGSYAVKARALLAFSMFRVHSQLSLRSRNNIGRVVGWVNFGGLPWKQNYVPPQLSV